MKAVFRHELASYFTGMAGYVFGAFLLLFAGIYTVVINIQSSLANFAYVLSNMAFLFLIIVPILTMGAVAEERRQKTDQLLYSLPLTMTGVTLGKYAALLVVFLLPTGILCLYPLVLSAFGAIYGPVTIGAAVGFFFLGAALLSVGLFLSSITESQGVAAGLCFVVLLVNYFLSDLSDYFSNSAGAAFWTLTVLVVLVGVVFRLMTGSRLVSLALAGVLEVLLLVLYVVRGDAFSQILPAMTSGLSLFEQFYPFVDGVFDLTSIVYFLTVIGIFLFLTVQSLEKRRWSA